MRKRKEELKGSNKGQSIRTFLPALLERQNLDNINLFGGLVYFLSGHGSYAHNLHRLGLHESSDCVCGERGSPEHGVFE